MILLAINYAFTRKTLDFTSKTFGFTRKALDFTCKTCDFTCKTIDFTRKTVIYDTNGLPYIWCQTRKYYIRPAQKKKITLAKLL